ncbi:MAG TPA: GNAT family N-acetyltransferase [Burkholderiaceae bacterium]
MEIRRAREGEAAALTALARTSKAHWPYTAEQIEAWREDLAISRDDIAATPVFLAEINGRVAGFYQLLPIGETWVLEHMWVLPEQMGKGIGRALLQHATRLAGEGGARHISIDADPYAEPFYRACGANTVAVKSAPVPSMPQRVRPQMLLAAR